MIYYNTFYIYIMILFLMFQSRNSHVPGLGESSPSTSTSHPDTPQIGLWHIVDLNEGLIGQWCAVKYDRDIYPGWHHIGY